MSDIDIITVRWDAERDVYKVNRPNWSGGEVVLWSAVKTMLASQAAEVARLTKENDWLRAYTGQSAKACVYCGLGADEMGKCERGFPGCARADDQMLCREVGVALERDELRADVLSLRERIAFLESREVCTVAHDHVETCGYCQRDALRAENEALRKDAETLQRVEKRIEELWDTVAPVSYDDPGSYRRGRTIGTADTLDAIRDAIYAAKERTP